MKTPPWKGGRRCPELTHRAQLYLHVWKHKMSKRDPYQINAGNRGSNQTMINCDNWPRRWPNQLHSALVYWSMCCNRQKATKETDGQVERLLPAPTRRDTHWVWGILTCRTGEGLVMEGLEIVHPAFSNVVSFLKSPLLPLFKWQIHQATFWKPVRLSWTSLERDTLGSGKGCPHCIYLMGLWREFKEVTWAEGWI